MLVLKFIQRYKPKLFFKKKFFYSQLGLKGILPSYKKKEGDFATPIGIWKLGRIMIRKDKLPYLNISRTIKKKIINIQFDSGWCDDIRNLRYNKFFKTKNYTTKNKFSFERLYRDDDVYDIIIEIKYNTKPIIKGKGSAIFLHCSFNDNRSTRGCLAIPKKYLIYIVKNLTKNTTLKIC